MLSLLKNFRLISFLLLIKLTSCDLFENEDDQNIDIITTFEETSFGGTFVFDNKNIPITGAFVQITKNSVFNDIIINIAPYNSRGSIAFPGDGWLQVRFNTEAKPGNLVAVQPMQNFSVADIDPIIPEAVQGLYINPNGRNYVLQQSARLNSFKINYKSPDDYDFNIDISANSNWHADLGGNSIDSKSGSLDLRVSAKKSPSSTNNNGGSTSGVNCAGGYQGPNFNIQVDGQCQAAFAYKCAGNTAGVTATCKLYNTLKSPSDPPCPYCD